MDREIQKQLADIIVKVKLRQDLSEPEARMYLTHVIRHRENEIKVLLSEVYEDGKLKNKKRLYTILDPALPAKRS